MENPHVIFGVDMDADHFSPLASVHAGRERGPAFDQPVRIRQFGWLGVHGFPLLSQAAAHMTLATVVADAGFDSEENHRVAREDFGIRSLRGCQVPTPQLPTPN